MAKKKTKKKKIIGFLKNVVLPTAISVTVSIATKVIMDKYSNNDGISNRLGELEDAVTEIQDHLEDEDRGTYSRGYLDGVDDHGEW